jgi:hypothetical protein
LFGGSVFGRGGVKNRGYCVAYGYAIEPILQCSAAQGSLYVVYCSHPEE